MLELKNYHIFHKILNTPQSAEHAKRLLDIVGVKYVVSSEFIDNQNSEILDLNLMKIVKIGNKNVYIYEYRSFPGRFLIFYSSYFIKDENEIIKNLYYQNYDLRKTLFLSSKEDKTEKYPEGNGKVKLISYAPNKVVLNASTDTDAFLYLSDTWYPGWKAYIDGKETEIYRANLTFRAVRLPKGTHEVVFQYRPMSFYIGALLTLSGVLLSIVMITRDRKSAKNTEA